MKPFVVLFLVLFGAIPAHGRDRVAPVAGIPSSRAIEGDEDQPTRPATLDWRATQVNRCTDAGGRIKLQDTPCSPVPSTAAIAVEAGAPDVVDLSALPPRSQGNGTPAPLREPGSKEVVDLVLSLAWKLGLFVVVGYAIFRMIGAWRHSYALAETLEDRPRRTR
jgi:hypothetical protein